MITKLASLYFSGTQVFASRNIQGYNIATLEIVVASGNTFSFTPRVTKDGSTPINTSDIPAFYKGDEKFQKMVTLTEGKYLFNIDITGCTNLQIYQSGNYSSASINFRQSEFVAPEQEALPTGTYIINAENPILELEGGKQLDVVVTAVNGGTAPIYFEASNDDFTNVTYITLWDATRNYEYDESAPFKANMGENHRMYANIDGYKKVRFRTTQSVGNCVFTELIVHKELVEGRKFTTGRSFYNYLNGYKYIKVNLVPSAVVNSSVVTSNIFGCSAFLRFAVDNVEVNYLLKYYNRGMVPAGYPTIYKKAGDTDLTFRGWELMSTASAGGYIVEFPDYINTNNFKLGSTSLNRHLTEYSQVQLAEIECYTHAPEPEVIITKVDEKEDYDVYSLPSTSVNRDVLNEDVLEWTDNSLTFWHGGYLGVKYNIPFTADNVNGFVTGEKINFAYLLPFVSSDRTRSDAVAKELSPSRIVVFTNTRVFHNFPARSGSIFPNSDVAVFDECRIYNPEKRFLPVNDKAKAGGIWKYLPVLKQYDYDQWNGRVNGTTGFVDTYGNGGLPANTKLQDIPVSGIQFWNRLTYSSMTKSDKYCAFGNYNTVAGSEPLVMVTNNGGRDWYVKAYFSCVEDYDYMYGSKIDLKPITDVSAFVASSLRLCHRKYNIPTAEAKEPAEPFTIPSDQKSLVTAIEYDSDGDLVVTLADNIDFGSGLPVVFFENVSAAEEWNYICNTGMNARGTTNTYIFFRAKKANAAGNKYKIFYDLGNSFAGNAGQDIYNNQSLICRHVHAVNAVEAGCLVSTGESYGTDHFEGGFLYLIEQNMKNGTNSINISAGSTMGRVIRLCSAKEGVNRASGAFIFMDNADPTLLYISDESFPIIGDTYKRYASIPDRTVKYPATPAGIFVGKLSDIDDQTKFKCVCELPMTGIGLLQAHGHFGADGHNTSISFSKNGFDWTIDVNDGSKINGYDNKGNIYFGNKVVMFK